MSTPQQIPTAAQLAAARLVHWRQSAPKQALAGAAASPSGTATEVVAEPAASADSHEHADEGTNPGEVPERGDVAHAGLEATPAATPEEDSTATELAAGGDSSAAVQTLEAAREFLGRCGLLLFAPRPQLGPAPSFVEATLGAPSSAPALAQAETARSLAARLIAEGSAVPLNLLGAPTTTAEAPDFLVSAAVFPYIFTLRGDKAWKQLPTSDGAYKVSPLSVNTYAMLLETGPKSAYALTGDLGKGLTEAAVLRALSELWQQLRVIPVVQTGNKPTLWEPTTSRFQRQIKSGANAGQPTALSLLISLYLGQAMMATEEEIESFLSPLAPRSRVRDVLHALLAAKELQELVIDGKQHLHLGDELPHFGSGQGEAAAELIDDGSRIRKFVRKSGPVGTGASERTKPFKAPAAAADRGAKPGRGARPADAGDRPGGLGARGPKRFTPGADRPRFDRPWEDERKSQGERPSSRSRGPGTDRGSRDSSLHAAGDQTADRPRRFAAGSPSKGSFGAKPRFGGDRPAFARDRPGGDARPPFRRADFKPEDGASRHRTADERPGRPSDGREFAPRGGEDRPSRKSFGSKPAFGEKRTPGGPSEDRERRPFRRDANATQSRGTRPGFRERTAPGSGSRSAAGESRPPFRKFDAPRGPRKPFAPGESAGRSPDERPRRPFAPREGGSTDRPSRKPFSPREGTGRADRRGFDGGARAGDPGKAAFGKRPTGDREPFAGGDRKSFGVGSRKPSAGAGRGSFSGADRKTFGKKPFVRSAGASAGPGAGPFDKFKGNAKPWGKRPPARKIKPEGEEA